MTGRRPGRSFWLLLAAVTAAALGLRAFGLADQPLIPDDYAVGQTAQNYTAAGWPEPTMWNHPRLRDLLVAGAQDALGDRPVALKLWSVVAGVLSVPATALLVLALGGPPLAALVAGLLVAADPLHLDFSRQAINDVYLALLGPAAVAAAFRYRAGRAPGWLLLAGALTGLGLASKLAIAFPVALAAVILALDAWAGARRAADRAPELALVAACLAVLPATVYLATFWPSFGRGLGLWDWAGLQLRMARETATHVGYAGTKLPGYFGEQVGAWRWFVQPAYYVDHAQLEATAAEGMRQRTIAGVAAPLAWLAVLPAAALAAWRWWRAGDRPSGLALLLFLATYLPFVVARRPIWTNSAPTVLPFAAALLGLAAAHLAGRWPRAVATWCAASVAVSAALWPSAMGLESAAGRAALEALVPREALDRDRLKMELLLGGAGAAP